MKFFKYDRAVYEVEWLKTKLVDGEYITYRHEGVRINSNIYIPTYEIYSSNNNENDAYESKK
jgi:hypothetical protein